MSENMPETKDADSASRLRLVGRIVFCLLIVLVYTGPEWMALPGSNRFMQLKKKGFLKILMKSEDTEDRSMFQTIDNRPYLWAGYSKKEWFDISGMTIATKGFKPFTTREGFPALVKPEFAPAHIADYWRRRDLRSRGEIKLAHGEDEADLMVMEEDSEVIVVKINDEVRIYPKVLMILHEVVNDEIDGKGFMVAYCVVANLGAVYESEMDGHQFTFGVSGYTYRDPEIWEGKYAFVLWDRDTQSLWLPTIGTAVSGPMNGTPLKIMDQSYWSQTTWGEVRKNYPDAKILLANQQYRGGPQSEFPAYHPPTTTVASTQPVNVAPRWGSNSELY